MKRRIKIYNKNLDYHVKKSKRAKRVRVAVYCDCNVVVTVPHNFVKNKLENYLRLKAQWIFDKIEYFKNLGKVIQLPNGVRAYKKYKKDAYNFVLAEMEQINKIYNFSYNKIEIKNHKTRWGSCTRKRNLNFNYKIMFLPEELAEYIIVHEICHLQEFNHSEKFWNLVEKGLPDFGERIGKLNKIINF